VNLKQVNHVGIRTKDMEKLGRFYTEVLGLTPHPEKRNWLKVGMAFDSMRSPAESMHAADQERTRRILCGWSLTITLSRSADGLGR
jgi:catechol 2,3-dioxygenase-like lactoylglutathione lyase family enzyme